MRTRVLAALVALGVFAFVGAFIWAAVRPPASVQASAAGATPAASVSDTLSDGRLDAQIFDLGNQDVQLDIQVSPNSDAVEMANMRPYVNFAMVGMHMDGFDPSLQLIGSGIWRANVKLPMAGRWVVSVGFGEDFVEMEFDAE